MAVVAAAAGKTIDKDKRGKRTYRQARRTRGPFPPRNTVATKGRWWGLSLPVKIQRDRKREMAEGARSRARARLPSDPAPESAENAKNR